MLLYNARKIFTLLPACAWNNLVKMVEPKNSIQSIKKLCISLEKYKLNGMTQTRWQILRLIYAENLGTV